MTGDELRAVEFRGSFRGVDPSEVDAALETLAARLDQGRLQRSDVEGLTFRRRLQGYTRDDDLRALRGALRPTLGLISCGA